MIRKIIKGISAILIGIVISLSFTVVFAASSETTYNITALSGKYKTQGRTTVAGDALMLDWTASGMVFKANCSGDVKITVDATRVPTGTTQGIYFTVIVDGIAQYEDLRIPKNNSAAAWTSNSTGYPFHITKSGETTFTIAENLKSGSHTFEIYKQTEAQYTSFGIKSVTLNGQITSPPAKSKLYIEVVGDSIAAGLGNISTGGQNAPLYQDSTRGWPYLTAKKLNADWSVIAQSSITATDNIGWAGTSSVTMPDVYPHLRYFSDKSSTYDFSRQPDIIVVCLGINDMWTYANCGATTATVKQGFTDMLTLLRSKNPSAKIIWIHGMMSNSADDLITSAVSEMGGNTKGYYSLKLKKDTAGGQGHPSLAAQSVYTESLVDFINTNILKSESDSSSSSNSGSSSSSSSNAFPSSKPTTSDVASSSSNGNSSATVSQNNSSDSNSSAISSLGSKPSSTDSNSSAISSLGSKPSSNEQNDTSAQPANNDKLPLVAIIGIAVCAAAVAAWCAIITIFLVRKKKQKSVDPDAKND